MSYYMHAKKETSQNPEANTQTTDFYFYQRWNHSMSILEAVPNCDNKNYLTFTGQNDFKTD